MIRSSLLQVGSNLRLGNFNYIRQIIACFRMMPDASILAQICQVLISETTPDTIRILCLKCLGNSCLDSYKYKQHKKENIKSVKYNRNVYDELITSDLCKRGENCDYPHDSHFPYDGVVEWVADCIKTQNKPTDCLTDSELDILRLSIQFLCNLFTYACPNVIDSNIWRYLNCDNLKQAIL